MTFAELRAWAKGAGMRLTRDGYNQQMYAAMGLIPDIGSGNRRLFGDRERRGLSAFVTLRRLCGTQTRHRDVAGRAVELAREHSHGHVVISEGRAMWHAEPEPVDWSALLAKGATVIPCKTGAP